jgi:hypothetical protein
MKGLSEKGKWNHELTGMDTKFQYFLETMLDIPAPANRE